MTLSPDRREILVEAAHVAADGRVVDALVAEIATREGAAAAASCAAEFEALRRQARALSALPRRQAPPALDGFVVAALQAGVREARAAGQVAALERVPAPAVLDRLVIEHIDPLRAPRELDARVEAQVGDGSEGVVRMMFERLPRLSAPAGLADRLADPVLGVASGGVTSSGDAVQRTQASSDRQGGPRSTFAARSWLLAGASLCAALALFGRWGLAPGLIGDSDRGAYRGSLGEVRVHERAPLPLTFEVVEYKSLANAPLASTERALASAMFGEWLGGDS